MKFRKDVSFITHQECKKYISVFRTVCNVPNGAELFNKIEGNNIAISDLVIDKIYNDNEICNAFHCSPDGIIRTSYDTNTLVLIAKHNNPHYDYNWGSDGILYYTVINSEDNQNISYLKNKILSTIKKKNIKVYLFQSYKDDEYYYDGEVELSGTITEAKE